MAADPSTNGRRHGRRARAISEEEQQGTASGGGATGDLALFARRSAVVPPDITSEVPVPRTYPGKRARRTEPLIGTDTLQAQAPEAPILTSEEVAPAEPAATETDSPTDGAAQVAETAAEDAAEPTQHVEQHQEEELPEVSQPAQSAIPASDLGSKKTSWFARKRKKRAMIASESSVEAVGEHQGDDFDVAAAGEPETQAINPDEIAGHGEDTALPEEGVTDAAPDFSLAADGSVEAAEHEDKDSADTSESLDFGSSSAESEESGAVDHTGDDLESATHDDLAEVGPEFADAEAEHASDAGDAQKASLLEDAEGSGDDAPALTDATAIWVAEPQAHDSETKQDAREALSPATTAAVSPSPAYDDDASEWLQVGDLPADQAPDPRPAPRFEGNVLNKPGRGAGGAATWITWILVALVLIVIVVLFLTGIIGPGITGAMGEDPISNATMERFLS